MRRWGMLVWGLGTLLLLPGCGERNAGADGLCPPSHPNAYDKPPQFSSCHQIRTNETVIDPDGGPPMDNVHRFFHCCS